LLKDDDEPDVITGRLAKLSLKSEKKGISSDSDSTSSPIEFLGPDQAQNFENIQTSSIS